ncbi:unnamed protein product [Paramecium primaurelia]|uniref:G-protein coupled receptors family 2 profile 2 domain-containing protein n=1 Tax=Paramecium primaurelia TaxID=5886 RepID=A0A8S1Q5H2_PARPR|nr:unnamed protein product [Paramecium primaurelia]
MDKLIQIKVICSSISLFSSTTVAVLFLSNPKLRTPTFRLVLQLQIADALFALASIINSNDDSNGLCVFQAFLVNYSRESSIIWIGIFAYNMCATIVDNQELPGLLKFYVVAIGIPFILSAYPFAWDAYGLNYSMCWLLPDSIALMVVDYLVLCIGILFYIIYFYIKIYNFLYNVTEMKSYKLFLYPLSFLLTQIWTMIDIFQKYDENSTFAFKEVAIAFVSLQGFINSLVYGLTPQVLEILKSFCYSSNQKEELQLQMTNQQDFDSSRQQSFIMPMGYDTRTQSDTSVENVKFNQQLIIAVKQQQEL